MGARSLERRISGSLGWLDVTGFSSPNAEKPAGMAGFFLLPYNFSISGWRG
jgi:hypothetical protein